jgi:hypothetical protein
MARVRHAWAKSQIERGKTLPHTASQKNRTVRLRRILTDYKRYRRPAQRQPRGDDGPFAIKRSEVFGDVLVYTRRPGKQNGNPTSVGDR